MIIKIKNANHFSFEEPYIKIGEGINGELQLGENLDITNNAVIERTTSATVINKERLYSKYTCELSKIWLWFFFS